MNIFLAYAYILKHEKELAQERFIDAKNSLGNSAYWKQRIASFGLENLYASLPSTINDVHNILGGIRSRLMVEIEQFCGTSKWDSGQDSKEPANGFEELKGIG